MANQEFSIQARSLIASPAQLADYWFTGSVQSTIALWDAGWAESDHFGWFCFNEWPHVWSMDHKWVYLRDELVLNPPSGGVTSSDQLNEGRDSWVYDYEYLGWFWFGRQRWNGNGRTTYPRIYSRKYKTWLFYYSGTSDPRDFYHYPIRLNFDEGIRADLALDADRNGTITFDSDETTSTQPYLFWINSDRDDRSSGTGEPTSSDLVDSADFIINGTSDLRDFSRIHIDVSQILDDLKAGGYKLAFRFKNTSGAAEIKIWPALDPDGGIGYLENPMIATQHLDLRHPGTVSDTTSYTIKQDFWDDISPGTQKAYFLFEGVAIGSGELVLEVKKNGHFFVEAGSVWLDLQELLKCHFAV